MSTLVPLELRRAARDADRPRPALLPDGLALARPHALVAAWTAGLGLCLVAAAIVLYFAVRGMQYLRPSLVLSSHKSANQAGCGGFLDPLLGTLLLTAIGMVLALPLAVATAVWIIEYGRPAWLARMIESCIEIVAGTPDIVIAMFGLAVFQLSCWAPSPPRPKAAACPGTRSSPPGR